MESAIKLLYRVEKPEVVQLFGGNTLPQVPVWAPILSDGKLDNQNHVIIFYLGEYLQLIDANHSNYLKECLKIQSILGEFEEYTRAQWGHKDFERPPVIAVNSGRRLPIHLTAPTTLLSIAAYPRSHANPNPILNNHHQKNPRDPDPMTPTPTSGKSRTPVPEDALTAHPLSQLPLQPVEVGLAAGGQSPPAQNTLGPEEEGLWPTIHTNVPGSWADELARSQQPGSTTASRWPGSHLLIRAFGASTLNVVKMESDKDDLSDPDTNEEEASDQELLALQVKQFWDTTNVLSKHRRRRLEERADRLVLRSTGAQAVGEMVA
ncbi:hypothetical protein D9615_007782 [Tricholomella constricta]|uniref:Glycosyl transferase 48 domain-containing protein n=1 Tax=Tricholomella constricta TaxID=117010 RepID=A0A8H5M0E2_9AGAR|nr:hypothetical protein D9615_007782 [Tricholomella constricta]